MPHVERPPVNFDSPPVQEVACSVLFSLPQPIRSILLGLYWARIKDRFPLTDEAAPVPAMLEPASAKQAPTANLELNFLPPMRRAWFSNSSQTRLIQLQGDRFIFNWKRVPSDSTYPRFVTVMAEFEREYQFFRDFLNEEQRGLPVPRQYELVYTNFIGPENGLGEVPPSEMFVDHLRAAGDRFLASPESFNWMTSYLMEGGFGRLHVHAQSALRMPAMESIVRLDLVARGIPPDPNSSPATWFKVAHEYITQGFADITSATLQTKHWKRIHEHA
jgi:uncharacterized protein (TIGR04255 family)